MSKNNVTIVSTITKSWQDYLQTLQKDKRFMFIDIFLAFNAVVLIFLFGFCLLGGSYPFNAFLGGVGVCVGHIVLTIGLRLQADGKRPERAFGEYVFASLLLHFVTAHFIN
ncbi:dolichyl-diphosphooligosaccharide-protein glycotransferase [Martiniozyma asiatica (nom. inval.)]|nr:dolichyl-diphosphooligosaccharide-protein glycotransferase [Martiniozyma asiatica]